MVNSHVVVRSNRRLGVGCSDWLDVSLSIDGNRLTTGHHASQAGVFAAVADVVDTVRTPVIELRKGLQRQGEIVAGCELLKFFNSARILLRWVGLVVRLKDH